jgi:rhodanese-related sulfurtransferase
MAGPQDPGPPLPKRADSGEDDLELIMDPIEASISPTELGMLLGAGRTLDLVDVRTPPEFREVHLAGARNLPLDRLDPKVMAQERKSKDQPLYIICQSGGRGRQACAMLRNAGADNVINVEGGTLACVQAGLPVIRGAKTISLERQVRIAAGTLVLLGTALGFFVRPGILLLPAFVGAGLVFAGLTDTCGMGLLLARMPWNRRG